VEEESQDVGLLLGYKFLQLRFSEGSSLRVRNMYLLQPLVEMLGRQDARGHYSFQPWGYAHSVSCRPPGTDILGEVVVHYIHSY